MRFMLLMLPQGHGRLPPRAASAAMRDYNAALRRAGVLLAQDGLHPPATGARVAFAGGRPRVSDGPFATATATVGGYWMLAVKSREEAIAWASRCPAGDDQVIEVRQVQESAAGDDPDVRAAGVQESR